MTLSMELTDEAEKGAFGVLVAVGVLVGSGVSVDGTKLAGVVVAGGVMDGNNVAVGERKTVGWGVQVGSNWMGVIVAVGVFRLAGFSKFKVDPGSRNTATK